MKHEDDELKDEWGFVLVHQSPRPLRWIANALGSLASWHILQSVFANEQNKVIKYSIHSGIGTFLLAIYNKYGSYYVMGEEDDLF